MPSQSEVADHLDMSERNARDVLKALGIDWKSSTLDDIRVAYIRDLRGKAAGRGGDEQKLASARTRKAEVETMSLEISLAKECDVLQEPEVFERELDQAITATKQMFLSMSEGLKSEIDARYGIDLDASIIDEAVHSTLSELAKYDPECEALDSESLEEVGSSTEDDDSGVG